jgi:hypothetical protein
VRAKLEFVWAEKIEDVLARALEAPAPRTQTPTETPQLAAA